MKTLITGGTGFLGSELSRILLDKGDEPGRTGHAYPRASVGADGSRG